MEEKIEKLKRQLVVQDGEFGNVEDQRYSSTEVSGSVTTNINRGQGSSTTSIGSHVEHHQVQKVWLTLEGKESVYTLHDRNIDARPGHKVRAIFSSITGNLLFLRNSDLDRYWFLPINIFVNAKSLRLRFDSFNPINSIASCFFKSLAVYIPLVDLYYVMIARMTEHIRSVLYFPTVVPRIKYLKHRPKFDLSWPSKRESLISTALFLIVVYWVMMIWHDLVVTWKTPQPAFIQAIFAPFVAWKKIAAGLILKKKFLFLSAANATKAAQYLVKGLPAFIVLAVNSVMFDYRSSAASKKIREVILSAASNTK